MIGAPLAGSSPKSAYIPRGFLQLSAFVQIVRSMYRYTVLFLLPDFLWSKWNVKI